MRNKIKDIMTTKMFWINLLGAISLIVKAKTGVGIDEQLQLMVLYFANVLSQIVWGKELKKMKREKGLK